ncbi:MAG: transcriptional repressor LexA [Chitinispirillaceae bacterium]|jgi:repressor LexA
MHGTTKKQKEFLFFIERYRRQHGMPPSVQEIQTHFGYSSPNSVQNHVRLLRLKGLLTDQNGKKRSLMSLLPMPQISVPLVGRIAAGIPIEAIENLEQSIDLSTLGIDNSKSDYFALKVKGNSMVNAHILDGDLVVIKKQPDVGPQEIAAVLWNNEATLKYVKKQGSSLQLVPANDTMRPITITKKKTESFQILGKVIRVIRSC